MNWGLFLYIVNNLTPIVLGAFAVVAIAFLVVFVISLPFAIVCELSEWWDNRKDNK